MQVARSLFVLLAAACGVAPQLSAPASAAAPLQGFAAKNPAPPFDVRSRFEPRETNALRALALSSDGSRVYVIVPDAARFRVLDPATFDLLLDAPIGAGPVSIARRPGTEELWIVDQFLDSVAIVDPLTGEVQRSVTVGADPMGIAFSTSGDRAYVTCSGVDRVDVIETATYSVATRIEIPARRPRGVVFHNGVAYVAPWLSGNNTATRGQGPGSGADRVVEVRSLADFPALPQLPDRDLFAIPAMPNPKDDVLDPQATRTGLGTILFDVALRPGSNELWIPQTDALNAVHVGDVNFVEGQVVNNRIAIVDALGAAPPVFVDLDTLAPTPDERVAQPTAVAFDPVRPRAYVAGQGTDRVAVLDLSGSTPAWLGVIEIVRKGTNPPSTGPRDLMVDPTGAYLACFNRTENSVSRIDLAALPSSGPFVVNAPKPIALGGIPLPRRLQQGRAHLENARFSKSQTSSCASCHVDGETDHLAWDLSHFADPEGTPNAMLQFGLDVKGPLVTQSLRSLAPSGPYHWRGERKQLDEFNQTFIDLLENPTQTGPGPLGPIEFGYIPTYSRVRHRPANPRQQQNRGRSVTEARGARLFTSQTVFGNAACATCHQMPYGTSGEVVANLEDDVAPTIVVPPLAGVQSKLHAPLFLGGDFGWRTEMGIGLGHGGVHPDIESVALQAHPTIPGGQKFNVTAQQAGHLAAFLRSLDNGIAPATRVRATAHASNASAVEASELALLIEQAERGHCELVFQRDTVAGTNWIEAGLFDPKTGAFQTQRELAPHVDPHQLILDALAGRPVTFFGVPLMRGKPLALDRDMDGIFDLDEFAIGTDPEGADTDADRWPDGYELEHGTDPLVHNAQIPDTLAPTFTFGPIARLVTQTAVALEWRTSEPCQVEWTLNGVTSREVLPMWPAFDDTFSWTWGELEPGSQTDLHLDLIDPAGNRTPVDLILATRGHDFGDPARTVSLNVIGIKGTGGAPDTMTVIAGVHVGGVPAAAGYTVRARLFHLDIAGLPTAIDLNATALTKGVTGRARFDIILPTGLPPGSLVVALEGVDAPPSEPIWVRAASAVTTASATW